MVAQRTYRLNRNRIATLKAAYDALEETAARGGVNDAQALVDFAREVMTQGSLDLPKNDAENGAVFMKTLNELAIQFRGKTMPTMENVDALREEFLDALGREVHYTPQRIMRPVSADWPRQMPGPDPKASVNNFMVSLAVLDPVFDLCARLDAKQTPPDGSNEVYYASRSAYGLKFTSSEEAENARDTFRKILKDGKDISINPRMVNHREEYWVEVPSDLATKIISETAALAKMRQDVAAQFEAGDKAEARENRRALYDIIDEMGFADGHVAAEMAREAIAPRVRAR